MKSSSLNFKNIGVVLVVVLTVLVLAMFYRRKELQIASMQRDGNSYTVAVNGNFMVATMLAFLYCYWSSNLVQEVFI